MAKTLRIAAIILLMANGISALLPGALLICDPSGRPLQMPLSMLQYSPFKNFLIPGILLFVMIGVSSVTIAILTIRRFQRYARLVLFQGCILAGWIVIQVYLLRSFHVLHLIYGLIGLVLMALGFSLRKSPP